AWLVHALLIHPTSTLTTKRSCKEMQVPMTSMRAETTPTTRAGRTSSQTTTSSTTKAPTMGLTTPTRLTKARMVGRLTTTSRTIEWTMQIQTTRSTIPIPTTTTELTPIPTTPPTMASSPRTAVATE